MTGQDTDQDDEDELPLAAAVAEEDEEGEGGSRLSTLSLSRERRGMFILSAHQGASAVSGCAGAASPTMRTGSEGVPVATMMVVACPQNRP